MGSKAEPLHKLAWPTVNNCWAAGGVVLTCDLVCRTSLARRYENEKLHYAIIDLGATRLHYEDILFSNTGHDLDTGLALRSGQFLSHKGEGCSDLHLRTGRARLELEPCPGLSIFDL